MFRLFWAGNHTNKADIHQPYTQQGDNALACCSIIQYHCQAQLLIMSFWQRSARSRFIICYCQFSLELTPYQIINIAQNVQESYFTPPPTFSLLLFLFYHSSGLNVSFKADSRWHGEKGVFVCICRHKIGKAAPQYQITAGLLSGGCPEHKRDIWAG